MTPEQYKEKARIIEESHPLTFPPEPAALTAYARAFRQLDEQRFAERVAEYKATQTPTDT